MLRQFKPKEKDFKELCYLNAFVVAVGIFE